MKLSIGQAWDETKQILRTDGSAIAAVALALMVLPGAVLETIAPSALRTAEMPVWLSLVGLLSALLSLTGQLAVSRIVLGPPTTVGAALGHSFRRMPALFGALLVLILPFALMLGLLAMTRGGDLQPNSVPPVLALPLILLLLLALFVFIRLLFLTPLAADSRLGPLALIRDSWRLSRGGLGKLVLLVLTLVLIALVLVIGLGGALSAVIILALGSVTPGSISAVLVGLVNQFLSAIVSVLFVTVVCRLYVQAKTDGASVSVPHAGGE